MAHSYHEIAFTPAIMDLQSRAGSRQNYAAMSERGRYNHLLGAGEAEFIARRDSFYMASISETGWPYVQHRGGPAGFMKVLDERTIGFADYAGNRQYVSTGNVTTDDRVSLFFMDYPNRRRLKLLGRVHIVEASEQHLLSQLHDDDYPVQIESAFVITVEGFDWNCPAHITPRFTEPETHHILARLSADNRRLRARPAAEEGAPTVSGPAGDSPGTTVLGDGPLELVISGVRQLAPRVRAFELRRPDGADLPGVQPGAHLLVPVRLASGELAERHYSIASNPARRDIYEIAVLREDESAGGSAAVHASYRIGTVLRVGPPANHFALHVDERPALLIAGGIGITPIKAMAQSLQARGTEFHLHYAGRSRQEMAFLDRLERQFADRITSYAKADGERLDIETVLAAAPKSALIYICGPGRLVSAILHAAQKLDIKRDRLCLELFD